METTTANIIRYHRPQRRIRYDMAAIVEPLIDARTAAGVLRKLPYSLHWIEEIQEEQLRLEAAGTSRIEGAEFTQREQDEALAPDAAARTDLTHSQRQLRAANAAYRWLRAQPASRPVTAEFILDIHRRIVAGCDDDHCEPGALRPDGWNVTFGTPRCRGTAGGVECQDAFAALRDAIAGEFRQHDGIIGAIAAHYHIGAMHPFGDGNGRTARALEAFMLRRAGVSDLVMVSLSNYYYEHKNEYLAALSESRQRGHDLTPLLRFALPAVTASCNAVIDTIVVNNKRILFREFARSLFGQLRSPRRRVLPERQLQILEVLLRDGPTDPLRLLELVGRHYANLKFPARAQVRDITKLLDLGAIVPGGEQWSINLDWPQQFSQSELLERYERLPSAASSSHPAMAELTQLLNRRRS